jgi:hypothetical protein
MVWTQLICRIFSLNTKQPLVQNTLFLDSISLPSPWELLDGFAEPFFRDIATPLTDSHLFSFIVSVKDLYPANTLLCGRDFSPQIADNELLMPDSVMPFFHRNHAVHLSPRKLPFCDFSPYTSTTRHGYDAALFHKHARLVPFGG